jgi:hypothetical protein
VEAMAFEKRILHGEFLPVHQNVFIARYETRKAADMLGEFLTLSGKRITTKLPQQSLQAHRTA